MELFKFSVMFLALTGLMCAAKMGIKIKEPDYLGALEEPAINILTNCYANRDKTILLLGNFPSSFVEKLASRRLFSLVFSDDRKRLMENADYSTGHYRNTRHKVHIVVILNSNYKRYYNNILTSLRSSRYYNTMAFVLIIGWSAIKKYTGCGASYEMLFLLSELNVNEILNVNLLCDHREMGPVLYGSNPFGNQAPKPWQFDGFAEFDRKPIFNVFIRQYTQNEDMCKNLDYTKTQDVGGAIIKTTHYCEWPYCSLEAMKNEPMSRYARLQRSQYSSFISDFIAYVNATRMDMFIPINVGSLPDRKTSFLEVRPTILRVVSEESIAYPYRTDCMYLISKFRGNKSQLKKVLSVIDSYSWIGIAIVYIITLMFFKYFLRQLLMDAILNVIRLSSNMGLTTLPQNVASQIYMTCLLSFVVTMQGIFVSNLAALLTQDIPVRQVDSVQDLSELGYRVYAASTFFSIFNDVLPEHRILELPFGVRCIEYVRSEPLNACLEPGLLVMKELVEKYDFHMSDCVQMEYYTNSIPVYWALEDTLNKFLGLAVAGGFMMPLYYVVDEKRLIEAESQVVDPEPRIMVFNDLAFAFVIFGTGLACSIVTFVIEIIIYRYHHRVWRTRVTFLN